MSLQLSIRDSDVIVRSDEVNLAFRFESQLAFWGFDFNSKANEFICTPINTLELIVKLKSFFEKKSIRLFFDKNTQAILNKHTENTILLTESIELGRKIKNGDINVKSANQFFSFLNTELKSQSTSY